MLIVCPTCATTYQIKAGALGDAGRNVRCASCKNTWFATPESAVMEEAAPVPVNAAAAPAAAKQPPAEDFTADFDGGFGVATAEPVDDPAAAEEAARALAVMDAPPLAPEDAADGDDAAASTKFDPGTPDEIETTAARRARHAYSDRKEKRSVMQRILSIPTLII